jgi:hypothetical protein
MNATPVPPEPASRSIDQFGFEPERVVAAVKALLGRP